MIQVAFRKSNGCLVHRLICLLSGHKEAHCEIVIDGRGVTPKHNHYELYHRHHSGYDKDWEFHQVEWDRDKVVQFVRAHKYTQYDFVSLLAFYLPFFKENPTKLNCVEFVVKCGSYCGDPLFHGINSSIMNPGEVRALVLQKNKTAP